MSNSRARGLEYAKSVVATRQNRKRQPDPFAAPRPKSPAHGPPSYIFQDTQRGSRDDKSEETRALRQEEKDLADDHEGDVIDKKDFAVGPNTGKAPPSTMVAASKPSSELKSVFAKCWTIVDDINIPEFRYDTKSWYLPSSISLFETLHHMEETLVGNEELRWVSPNFFSLPVRVYYAVLFYVQVLRAKEQAGALTKSEGSWLRAFFRRYKDVSCPIAGPLVPIFMNITCVSPDDDQFSFVHPNVPSEGSYNVAVSGSGDAMSHTLNVNSSHAFFPSVPLVASLLRSFCADTLTDSTRFDADGQYVPFKLSSGTGPLGFAGHVFPTHTNGSDNPSVSKLLHNPVLSHPLPESKNRLKEIRGFWSRSICKSIPKVSVTQSFSPRSVGEQTFLNEEIDWFQPCVDMALVQTKFFSESTNLSQIKTLGPSSTLVVSELKFNNVPSIPSSLDEWYPACYGSCKAKFYTTIADLSTDGGYSAAYALTNSTLEWKDTENCDVGSAEANHKFGPFFENRKTTFAMEHEFPVMRGIYAMLLAHFYDARGKAT